MYFYYFFFFVVVAIFVIVVAIPNIYYILVVVFYNYLCYEMLLLGYPSMHIILGRNSICQLIRNILIVFFNVA